MKTKFGAVHAESKFSEALHVCDMARESADIVRRRLPV
jgi:hypothetical protein